MVAGVITLVGAALLAVLAAGVPALAAYATESALGPAARPVAGSAVGSTVTTVEETSRAGSAAGEGRERPGGARPPILDPPPAPYTPPPVSPPPPPRPTPVAHRDTASDPAERTPVGPVLPNLRVLPLGGGLVLIGLGLGFLGLRLRRG